MTDLETKLYDYASTVGEDDRALLQRAVDAMVRMRIHLERYADHGGNVADWRDQAKRMLRELGAEA